MNKVDFKDCRSRIPIVKAAEKVGYVLRPEKGKGNSVCMGIPDGHGGFMDNVIVINGATTFQNHYFNPNNSFDKGDLISFIQNRINDFESHCCVFTADKNTGNSAYGRVSRVLAALLDLPMDTPVRTADGSKARLDKPHTFDISTYIVEPLKPINRYFLTEKRCLAQSTIERFSPFIQSVAQRKNPGFFNTAFPYREPGKPDVCNFEIRNVDYKRHAAGGNKVSACWIAQFTDKPWEVERVLLFESAIDAMSYYELNWMRIQHQLSTLAFISVGGRVTRQQILGLREYFSVARFVCCFDNDFAGTCFDIFTALTLAGKDYSIVDNGDQVDFVYNGQKVTLEKEKLSLWAFSQKTGFRYNVLVHKPRFTDNARDEQGDEKEVSVWFKDWNDGLKARKTPQKDFALSGGQSTMIMRT